MADRENIIQGLEQFKADFKPFCGNRSDWARVDDAINLLKDQKAIPPGKESDGNPGKWTSWWYVCGACGREIDYHDRFCRWCGRSGKWE